jgi:ABC-type dipeptide/oligopeptide/nickel transport system permease subunit
LALIVIAAIFSGQLAPEDPLQQDLRLRLSLPSARNILGTDEFGRDILSRLIFGARISLTIVVGANFLAGVTGVALGVVTGYYGGVIDFLGMRPLDVFLAFPGILLAIAIVAVIGPGLVNITSAVALFSFPVYARVARSVALSLREKDFILAARSLGASDTRIITRHILPNSIGSLLVILCVQIADSLLTASSLSFLGLGAPPYVPEWGSMLNSARPYMLLHPHVILFPGLAIAIAVMGFNLTGQMLTDFADPFKRRR